GDRGAGGAVAEALRGVRHHHQPHQRVGDRQVNADPLGVDTAVAGTVTTVVIGAGHAGLAMSRCLTELGIDHVVLERGEVGNAWLRERWDSMRLLTPNWQTRLPGFCYAGTDPDGFMTAAEVAEFIARYAVLSAAPVRSGTTVTRVRRDGLGYRVGTDRGSWRCRTLVLASGAHNLPSVPA